MSIDSNIVNIFVPGGPCISGEYWDLYLSMSGIKGRRLKLLNHEVQYNPNESVTFDRLVEDLKKQILESYNGKKINVIAHSFGAWVLLKALNDENIKSKISKAVLVSLPLSVSHSETVTRSIEELYRSEINNNADFKAFWKKILPLYITQSLSESIKDSITNNVYWEGNNGIALKPEDLKDLVESIQTNSMIKLIWGAKDIITPPPSESMKYEVVTEAGHFPMLECLESFTSCLNKTLFK